MADLGWYPDPAKRHAFRFFDGSVWTEHVADDGQRSLDPLNGAAVASHFDVGSIGAGVPTSVADPAASHLDIDEASTVKGMLRRSRRADASFGSTRTDASRSTSPAGAGWYPDPSRAHYLRYFDGHGWTEYVADDDGYRIDPI